jgi:soluble lytic murein transglycosylase
VRITKGKGGPSTKAAAHYMLADLADDAGDWRTAAARYNATIEASPRNEYAVTSYMRLGTHALAAHDFDGAIATFKRFVSAHAETSHAQQAYFWLGQAHLRAQHTNDARTYMSKARDVDPFTYYGLLAGEWLKQPPAIRSAGPVTNTAAKKTSDAAATRVHFLKEVGLADASAFELYRVTQELYGQPAALYAFAEGLVANNEAASAIRIGLSEYKKAGSWNRRLLQIVYPFPFEQTIKSEAKKAGVDPYLVAALIRQESTFDPAARSRVGAIGLMQVMPATAAAIAGKSQASAAELLLDPAVNVHLGVTHLRGLIAQYHGQPAFLLAAYNAGQTPVARWMKLPGGTDPLLFAERIPYVETRGYAQIVQRNAHMYRLLYQ